MVCKSDFQINYACIMRKMKFLSMATAFCAVAVMTTSCWNSSDDPVTPPAKISNINAEKYSVIASSNVEAEFSISEAAITEKDADKKGVSFTDIDTSIKMVKVVAIANGDDYVNKIQTAIVNFSEKNPSATIAFTFVKKSTDTKTQDEVKSSTTDVTVSSDQTAGSEANADMTIPAGVGISGDVDPNDPFSVTAYETPAAVVNTEDIKVGQPISTDQTLMVMECTPSGAQFDKPVALTVFVGTELAGETLTIANKGEKVSGVVKNDGNVTFNVNHFSDWDLIFAPWAKEIKSGSKTLANLVDFKLAKGINEFDYTKLVGVDAPNARALVAMYFSKYLGELDIVSVKETATFESSAEGIATVNIVQNYNDYTFEFGKKTFKARVWGNVEMTVTPKGGEAHSGGVAN